MHDGQQSNADERTAGAAEQKERKRLFIEPVAQRQTQNQQNRGIDREKQADRDVQRLCGNVADEERLRSAVRNREQHDNDRNREHLRVGKLHGFAGIRARCGRQALVVDKLHHQQRADREGSGKNKGGFVADLLVKRHADSGRNGHRECVHRAVQAHAGADFVAREQVGHPGGHADRAAGKANAVYHAGGNQADRIPRGNVAEAGHGHAGRADHEKMVFADLIREIADKRTAEQRADVHQAADHAHQSRACA